MRKFLVLLLLVAFGGAARAQIYQGRQLVEPALLAAADAVVPGQKITVGLRLKMQPGWHTYWRYSGDSGMPTRLDWELPPGFRAGEIQWPIPEKIVEEGDLWTYAYRDEVLLLVELTPPADFAEKQVTLKAHAHWLVCEKICVPGETELSVTLPVAPVSKPAHEGLFAKYRVQLPQDPAMFSSGAVGWRISPGKIALHLSDPQVEGPLDFFPLPGEGLQIGHVQAVRKGTGEFEFAIPITAEPSQPLSFAGVLVMQNADGTVSKGWFLDTGKTLSFRPTSDPAHQNSLLNFLLLGFLGGLILNVMPCVLPVIALKIFGFIKQAGESRAKIFRLGLAFIAGIFAWFLTLAALVAAFKSAGHELNWAFQFQHPGFLIAMIAIILVFALNLLGLFEIVLPGRAQNRLAGLSAREGYGGTFLHGVFATLMATPCTAPFLGPALGFAFAQPPAIIFAMFAAIASGMSAPYLLLAAQPGWMRFLPKPGVWMVRVKQLMGVLLLGTVAWLGWVLWQQQHHEAQPFAPMLEAALKKDRPVFVDFTADWCVNCKVNEKLVLRTDAVQRAFRENDVIFLQADWTNGDAAITKLLQQFGRAGVPLYVLYPPRGEPVVLPEIITTQIVLEALKRVRNQAAHD